MSENKFAKSANYFEKVENKSDIRTNKVCKLKRAMMTLVKELNIKNGSFKIFVHDGKPGERVEIQSKVITTV